MAEGSGDQDTVRLFQYGSNMHRERFMQRIRDNKDHAPAGTHLDAKLLGPARLDGWRLHANLWSATLERRKREDPSLGDAEACRVLNVVREEGAEVWGTLYEIASDLVTRCDGERSVVDLLEGHRTTRDPENYAKICITVDLEGEPRTAWTYSAFGKRSIAASDATQMRDAIPRMPTRSSPAPTRFASPTSTWRCSVKPSLRLHSVAPGSRLLRSD